MNSQLPYNDFGTWLRTLFPYKIQKISVNAGFSCPNRDGRISTGGCTFCDNNTFNPSYCDKHKTIRKQLETGKLFFRKKVSRHALSCIFPSLFKHIRITRHT